MEHTVNDDGTDNQWLLTRYYQGTERLADSDALDTLDTGIAGGTKILGSYANAGVNTYDDGAGLTWTQRANDGQVILAGTRAGGVSLITGGATSAAKSVVTVPAGEAMDTTEAVAYDWARTARPSDTPAASVDEATGTTRVAGGDVGEVKAPVEELQGRIWYDDDNDGLLSETTDAKPGAGADTPAAEIPGYTVIPPRPPASR